MTTTEDVESLVLRPQEARSATEDGGQRLLEDMSASEMSDNNPAGMHPYTPLKRHSRISRDTLVARRGVSLDVRLTVADRAAIRDRARVLGVKPSAWGRAVMLDALDPRREHATRMHEAVLVSPQPERAAAVEQLRRVGVNLNQVLRSGTVVPDDLLREVLTEVRELRAAFGDRTVT